MSQFIPIIVSVLFNQGGQSPALKSLFELLKEEDLDYADAVSTGLVFLSSLIKVQSVSNINNYCVGSFLR